MMSYFVNTFLKYFLYFFKYFYKLFLCSIKSCIILTPFYLKVNTFLKKFYIFYISTKIKSSPIQCICSHGIIISLLLENKLRNLLFPPGTIIEVILPVWKSAHTSKIYLFYYMLFLYNCYKKQLKKYFQIQNYSWVISLFIISFHLI